MKLNHQLHTVLLPTVISTKSILIYVCCMIFTFLLVTAGNFLLNSNFDSNASNWITWPDSSIFDYSASCPTGMSSGCGKFYQEYSATYSSGLVYNSFMCASSTIQL